jgi:hypothetical protein
MEATEQKQKQSGHYLSDVWECLTNDLNLQLFMSFVSKYCKIFNQSPKQSERVIGHLLKYLEFVKQ